MDEKDLNENEEKLTDVNNDSVDSGLEEKDGVKYVITSSQHSIKNGVHYNKIDMERLV